MDATNHKTKIIQILANTWRIAGSRKTEEVSRCNRVPIARLIFVTFEVGDKFYRAVQPAPTYCHFTEMRISNKERDRERQEVNSDFRIDGKLGKQEKELLIMNPP